MPTGPSRAETWCLLQCTAPPRPVLAHQPHGRCNVTPAILGQHVLLVVVVLVVVVTTSFSTSPDPCVPRRLAHVRVRSQDPVRGLCRRGHAGPPQPLGPQAAPPGHAHHPGRPAAAAAERHRIPAVHQHRLLSLPRCVCVCVYTGQGVGLDQIHDVNTYIWRVVQVVGWGPTVLSF